MNKFINKQEAIDALGERPISWTDSEYELGKQNQYDEDMLALIDVPTVEAEPVRHGRWEYKHFSSEPHCSLCLAEYPIETNYCHNCGAKMDGGKSNERPDWQTESDADVVRCENCANNPKRSILGCPMRNDPNRDEDDYCIYWERMTDEQKAYWGL